MTKPAKLRIELTEEQKAKVREAVGKIGENAEAIELDVEELEERISPRGPFNF